MTIKEKLEQLKKAAKENQISPDDARAGHWVMIEESRGAIRLKTIDRTTEATLFIGTSKVRRNKMRISHSDWAWSDVTVLQEEDAREIYACLKTSRLMRQISEALSNPAEVPVRLAEEIEAAWNR